MGRPFYSKIAKQWHEATGHRGGPFKRYVLNDLLIREIGSVDRLRIIEIGAGNGYFMPMLLRRYSGESPERITVTDRSGALLEIARESFRIDGAEYEVLDASQPFPFESASFDLVIATMVFNELPTPALRVAIRECRRVLATSGRLVATVTHPEFVESLKKQGKLSQLDREFWTMPGAGSLRVPAVVRSQASYEEMLSANGFEVLSETVYPTTEVLNERPGLRHAGSVPLGLLLRCRKHPS